MFITKASFFWLLAVCAGYIFEVMLVSPCFETLLPFSSVIFMGHCDARGPSKLWIVQWSPCVSPTTHREASQQWTLHTIDPTSSTGGLCYTSECCPPSFLWYFSCCCPLCSIHRIWLFMPCFFPCLLVNAKVLQMNPEVWWGKLRKKINFVIARIRAGMLLWALLAIR